MSALAMSPPHSGQGFLAALADPARGPLRWGTAIVVAHPDDETIGCGAQLPRFSDLTIVHVTNGAPRNGADAVRSGFPGPEQYAAARGRELEAAMALAGLPRERLVSLGWSDQDTTLHLAEIATELARRLAGTEIVLTHAYEGGHPDHDSVAFAVSAACSMLRRDGAAPAIIEMPLYRAGPEGRLPQSFWPNSGEAAVELKLSEEEIRLKDAMLAAFHSQRDVLSWFTVEAERFRLAPDHDFAILPNGGDLYYERMQWGMTSARWLQSARAAAAALRSGGAE